MEKFREALEADTLHFARTPSLLGYAGNGNGVCSFIIDKGEGREPTWGFEATYGPLDTAVELQLRHKVPAIDETERSALVQLILSQSKVIDWDNDLFKKAIMNESYADVVADEHLSDLVLKGEPTGTTKVALNRLHGIQANQLRVSSFGPIRDGIDLVLRVAEINLEIVMSALYGECDVGTSEGAERILVGKLVRAGVSPSAQEKFLSLVELTGVPDVREAVASGSVGLGDIFELRDKKVSRDFRKWLRTADAHDARELERLYVSTLGQSSTYTSLPVRLIRFAITIGADLLFPFAGTGIGVADSFFVEKWLEGYSPKLFLDELGKLPK